MPLHTQSMALKSLRAWQSRSAQKRSQFLPRKDYFWDEKEAGQRHAGAGMELTISVARWAFKMRPVINGAEFCGMHIPAVSAYANKRKKEIWMKGLDGNRRCIPLPVRMHMRKHLKPVRRNALPHLAQGKTTQQRWTARSSVFKPPARRLTWSPSMRALKRSSKPPTRRLTSWPQR